jgi:nicotinamidase-related amidase
MNKLLLIIDYQTDFVAADGRLTAGKPAENLEQALVSRAESYLERGADVLCTLDTHREEEWHDHPEGEAFAVHCLENTEGWALFGRLNEFEHKLETITKGSYMLDHTDIDWIVRQYDQIELAGVTTDICVLQNAIGLYNHAANIGRGLKLICSPDLVASFDHQGHEYALKYMYDKLGVKKSEDVS